MKAQARPLQVKSPTNADKEGSNQPMSVLWIVLACLAVLVLLLFAVMDRAKQEDRMSRHIQHTISPFDDITITKPGQ